MLGSICASRPHAHIPQITAHTLPSVAASSTSLCGGAQACTICCALSTALQAHSLPQRLLVLLHVEKQARQRQAPNDVGVPIVLQGQAAGELLPRQCIISLRTSTPRTAQLLQDMQPAKQAGVAWCAQGRINRTRSTRAAKALLQAPSFAFESPRRIPAGVPRLVRAMPASGVPFCCMGLH